MHAHMGLFVMPSRYSVVVVVPLLSRNSAFPFLIAYANFGSEPKFCKRWKWSLEAACATEMEAVVSVTQGVESGLIRTEKI